MDKDIEKAIVIAFLFTGWAIMVLFRHLVIPAIAATIATFWHKQLKPKKAVVMLDSTETWCSYDGKFVVDPFDICYQYAAPPRRTITSGIAPPGKGRKKAS